MTTAWPQHRGEATEHHRLVGAPGDPLVVADPPAAVDPAAVPDPGAAIVSSRTTARGRPRGPSPRRLSALLVLLLLPLSVLLTVLAMVVPPPAGPAGRPATAVAVLPGLRVQVVDGVGDPALVRLVADRLAAAGATVVGADGTAGVPPDITEILYHDPSSRQKAAEVQRTLGVGKVMLDRSLPPAVEVSIVVGKDVRYE